MISSRQFGGKSSSSSFYATPTSESVLPRNLLTADWWRRHDGDPGSYSGYSAHCWLRLPSCVSLDYTDTSCVLTTQAIVVSLLTTQTQALSLCVSSFCIRSCTPQGGKWSSVMPRSDKIEDWENDGEEVLNVPYLGFKNPLIPSAAHFFWAPSLFRQLQMPTGGCCFHECLL